MDTNIHEVAEGVYRLSTVVEEAAPGGFTFNQYLIDGEQPMLFHTGARALFPLVHDAVGRVIDCDRLRWISFGHLEADESGSTNQWLAAAPAAEVIFNPSGAWSRSTTWPTGRPDRAARRCSTSEAIDFGPSRHPTCRTAGRPR